MLENGLFLPIIVEAEINKSFDIVVRNNIDNPKRVYSYVVGIIEMFWQTVSFPLTRFNLLGKLRK